MKTSQNTYFERGKERVGVIGLGVSGKRLVEALIKLGFEPIGFEKKSKEEFLEDEENEKFLREKKIEIVFGYSEKDLQNKDISFFVLSSGVKHDQVPQNKKFISELDFVFTETKKAKEKKMKSKFVLITGTKGKGTTTKIVSDILTKSRIMHFVGGNIGKVNGRVSTCADAIFSQQDIIILEVSSFQLRSSFHINPHTLAITSIHKDHLDYHPSMFDYFYSKIKLAERSKFIVIPADLKEIFPKKFEIISNEGMHIFRKKGEVRFEGWTENSTGNSNETKARIKFLFETEKYITEKYIEVKGAITPADITNSLCAVGVIRSINQNILRNLDELTIERRKFCFERVGSIKYEGGEIEIINDGKSTDPLSLANALLALKGKRKVLIAGGKTKGFDFSDISEFLADTEFALLIGEDREKLAKFLPQSKVCSNLKDAVDEAVKYAKQKKCDVIIFSPGCASYPDFRNAEERGKTFEMIMKEIIDKK